MLIDYHVKPLSQLVAAAIEKGARYERIAAAIAHCSVVFPPEVARVVAEDLRFAVWSPALTNMARIDRLVTEILAMREAAA